MQGRGKQGFPSLALMLGGWYGYLWQRLVPELLVLAITTLHTVARKSILLHGVKVKRHTELIIRSYYLIKVKLLYLLPCHKRMEANLQNLEERIACARTSICLLHVRKFCFLSCFLSCTPIGHVGQNSF